MAMLYSKSVLISKVRCIRGRSGDHSFKAEGRRQFSALLFIDWFHQLFRDQPGDQDHQVELAGNGLEDRQVARYDVYGCEVPVPKR